MAPPDGASRDPAPRRRAALAARIRGRRRRLSHRPRLASRRGSRRRSSRSRRCRPRTRRASSCRCCPPRGRTTSALLLAATSSGGRPLRPRRGAPRADSDDEDDVFEHDTSGRLRGAARKLRVSFSSRSRAPARRGCVGGARARRGGPRGAALPRAGADRRRLAREVGIFVGADAAAPDAVGVARSRSWPSGPTRPGKAMSGPLLGALRRDARTLRCAPVARSWTAPIESSSSTPPPTTARRSSPATLASHSMPLSARSPCARRGHGGASHPRRRRPSPTPAGDPTPCAPSPRATTRRPAGPPILDLY